MQTGRGIGVGCNAAVKHVSDDEVDREVTLSQYAAVSGRAVALALATCKLTNANAKAPMLCEESNAADLHI